ncbi:MAG TPA: leucine-rich repeat protein [Clostridiales bacterium]|nr:leucine-rich repeat protein [Clostridiales bacterium]
MEIASGVCGLNVNWKLLESDEDVILKIEGDGPMTDYGSKTEVPYAGFCKKVKKIIVKPGVTAVGDYAFSNFGALLSVDLPCSVVSLGNCAFSACTTLESVTLPEGLQIIGPKAFEKCASLEFISLPSTLVAVDFKAFKGSDNLTLVNYAGTPAQWERQVRVSRSSQGNKPLLEAEFTYRATTRRYDDITSKIRTLIEQGGDGRLYIIAPDLTVENVPGKSGDCMLLLFPDGQTMLIDSGAPASEERIMLFVKQLGLEHLDYFVLSHPHGDHIGNALKVVRHLYESMSGSVGTYCYTGFEYKTEEGRLAAYLSEHGTRLQRDMRAGQSFSAGGVRVEVFNPFDEDMHPDSLSDAPLNNSSLLMKFTYGKSTFLTGGDLYASREALLVHKFGSRLASDVAKTNHHGCYTSNSDLWLNTVRPKILLSNCDDILWTLFSEKLAAKNIEHYKVSERGLTVISMGREADYQVETEF